MPRLDPDSRFVRHYEAKYLRKLGPRNVRTIEQTRAQLDALAWEWPFSRQRMNSDDVVRSLDSMGIKASSHLRCEWFQPPKANAGVGWWWSPICKRYFTGHKLDSWQLAMEYAGHLMDDLLSDGRLRWSLLDDEDEARTMGALLAAEHKWLYVPTWRLDGGPRKLRMLLIGNSPMYILEHWAYAELGEALNASKYVGDRPSNVYRWFAEARAGKLMSGDFERYDQSQHPSFLKAVYKGLGEFLGWPESLAVALWLYNCYTPALVADQQGRLVIRWRNGQAASGIGGFSYVNTVGSASACDTVARSFGDNTYEPGCHKGDDQVIVLPSNVGVSAWWRRMNEICGLSYSPVDSLVSLRGAVFLRRVFYRGRWESDPLWMSRFRNACFPEDPEVQDASPVLTAVRYRAQSEEVFLRGNTAIQGCWSQALPSSMGLFDEIPYMWDLSKTLDYIRRAGIANDVVRERCEEVVRHATFSRGWYAAP